MDGVERRQSPSLKDVAGQSIKIRATVEKERTIVMRDGIKQGQHYDNPCFPFPYLLY